MEEEVMVTDTVLAVVEIAIMTNGVTKRSTRSCGRDDTVDLNVVGYVVVLMVVVMTAALVMKLAIVI